MMKSWSGTPGFMARIGVFSFFLLAGSAQSGASEPSSYLFQIHGSNTIGHALGPALVEGFLIQKGCNAVTIESHSRSHESIISCNLKGKQVAVKVSAKGSATGFKAMGEGVAQIVASSRKAHKSEIDLLAGLGDLLAPGSEHIVALDALAIIVNTKNPVDSLTLNEIALIFTGVHSNWKKLGGKDQPINLLVRTPTSGTRETFNALVLGQGEEIYQRHQPIHSNREAAEEVFYDSKAIAFTGIDSVGRNKTLAISAKPGAGTVEPTDITVTTEEYPLTRELYFYMPEGVNNADARDFLTYISTGKAQAIIEETGFVPLTIKKVEQPSKSKSNRYQRAVRLYQRLNVNIHFRDNDRYIDNFGLQRIKRLAQFMEDNNGTLMLLGNYGSGRGKRTRQFSMERAVIVSRALIDAGVSKSRILIRGMGDEHSMSMESMNSRRARGVHVEVWYKPWFSGE